GANQAGTDRALTFFADRTAFETAFPGLPTEDFSATLVGGVSIVSCAVPWNSTTNNACFAPGGIMAGIELDVNMVSGGGEGVVLGIGSFGNTHVWVGPNSFNDDLVLRFDPAVRAVGFDLVNPMTAPQTHTVEIWGPSGPHGNTAVIDAAGEGNFWGVADDAEGISSIVFNNADSADHSELVLLVTFGGEPVPVELESFMVE
ncbi:MAG: hypothetical protein ABFS37_15235, partial [Acidobacteriota bacterium]